MFFDYPPHPRTIAHTVKGFDDMARLGAQVTIFRLGNDPGLARFIDQVARRVEGRVVVPDLDGLGRGGRRRLSAVAAPPLPPLVVFAVAVVVFEEFGE